MADDDNTIGPGDSNESVSPDPLSILGWKVGGKYVMRSYIGGGGFGEVYEGYNANLPDQRLVFKFFKRVQQRSKFDKEARILCLLDHPNISRVIDYLPDEGAVVVAFIDGYDGRQILKNSGKLDEETFLKVCKALTDAIAYAHEKNIAHRDLKPGNIMFDKNGAVYLIDFGIAKEIGEAATRTAYQALTPMFAAPERQEGEADYNPFLSDIFEAGVTLYNFATNDLPYRNPANPNYNEWGGEAAEHLSDEIRQVLMRATHPDPEQRYKTAREFAEAMKTIKKAYGGDKPKERKKGKAVWALPLLAVIVVAAALGYMGRDKIMTYVDSFKSDSEPRAEARETNLKTAIDSILMADSAKTPDTGLSVAADDSAVSSDSQTNSIDSAKVEEPIEIATKPHDETKPQIINDFSKPQGDTAAVAKPEPKPKRTRFNLSIDVVPTGVSYITVNGDSADVGRKFKLKKGDHLLKVYHREYPIYEESITISNEDRTKYIDMSSVYSATNSVNLQIALSPPTQDFIVDLAFNGRGHTLMEFPVFDFSKRHGLWDVGAAMIAMVEDVGSAKVDSLVTFPHGGGKRTVIRGSHGELNLIADKSELDKIPLLIYWTKK